MKLSLSIEELEALLHRQLAFFRLSRFPSELLVPVLERTERCFGKVRNKYYSDGGNVLFDPFHSGQYAQFLYYLSNTAYRAGEQETAAKVYCLNKMLHNVEWFYEVCLPDVFFADHALGSVMGRAQYGNRFAFVQGCSVGQNRGQYPILGENILMHPNACIFGNCHIGDHVEVAAQTVIIDQDVPSHSIVFGRSPELKIVQKSEAQMRARLTNFYENG